MQTLPSLQLTAVCVQAPVAGMQLSSVQGLRSSH